MPTANFFYTKESQMDRLNELALGIKACIAAELTCGNKKLDPSEVSIRLIRSEGDGMIAELEAEITAHAFPERVENQDEICLHVREYLMQEVPANDIRVWLLLPQLGHSWE